MRVSKFFEIYSNNFKVEPGKECDILRNETIGYPFYWEVTHHLFDQNYGVKI